ncbi:esterase/lipase family protein [Brevundimonas aurifodinae]|uniref:Lipase n=2 Tax=Brevundimonas TaxID=41275 RepID=A0ABV1NLF9_9CAUL|nr:MAG: lipase [Brevundimonas sp. 12-68-7]OYX31587.1 MAG: lipase [Brevundimonas subvibrioides]
MITIRRQNPRPAGHRLLAALAMALGLGGMLAGPATAGPTTLEATYSSGIQNGWVRVERWRDTTSAFTQEAFPPDGRGDQTGQRATYFADASPHSSKFLMYYAPGWNTGTRPVPVLLVHGANQDADVAWADPNEAGPYGCGRYSCPSTGMMQSLSGAGYKVFALGLPHKNGDGYFWSEQIADAIAIIKSRTGATQVDVVAWSKAASNARMYVSNVRRSWGTNYRGDIRRLILLGSANNGIDLSFRHGWTFSLVVYPECGGVINGPTPHDYLVCYGAWREGAEWTYASTYFPGSAQLLKRWDATYALPTYEQDWYTTFHGGQGFYSSGPGIDAYLGASLVNTIRNAPSPSGVRIHNLCGNQNDIALLHNEHTGPSDGVVFIQSCRDIVGVTNHGGSATLAVNHLELGWEATALTQVRSWLAAA